MKTLVTIICTILINYCTSQNQNYLKVIDFILNEQKEKKIYFSGALEQRISFSVTKLEISNLIDSVLFNEIFKNDSTQNQFSIERSQLRRFNFTKKVNNNTYKLYIYPERKVSYNLVFIRAVLSDGSDGIVYYFLIGRSKFFVQKEYYNT